MLSRMIEGDLPDTAPSFFDQVRFKKQVKVTSREWQVLAPRAFVWIDYISVRARSSYYRTMICLV